jgi:hypothetical protein
MDYARRLAREDAIKEPAGQENVLAGLEKVLRLATIPREGSPDRPPRDWSAALEMIHNVAKAFRATEEHAAEMELRADTLTERTTEELRSAALRIQAADARANAAEARAEEAEKRAEEAEVWLARLHDVIVEELPTRRPAGADQGF